MGPDGLQQGTGQGRICALSQQAPGAGLGAPAGFKRSVLPRALGSGHEALPPHLSNTDSTFTGESVVNSAEFLSRPDRLLKLMEQ